MTRANLKKIISRNFTLIPLQPNQKMKQYKCNHCSKKYAINVTRMAKHLRIECRNCPKKVIEHLKSMYSTLTVREELNHSSDRGSTDSSFIVEELEETAAATSPSATPREDRHQNSVSDEPLSSKRPTNFKHKFYDSMNEKEENTLNHLLAMAIYSSGTPFSITESIYWQRFFNAIRPSYKLPTRRKVSNEFLDSTYEKVKNEVDGKIMDAETVGVQCDSWSNIRNECIMNFIVTTPRPLFFKTLCTSSTSKSAVNCSRKMMEVIETIGPQKVMGVCTDNEPVMKCSWEILDEQYEEHCILFYGCIAHNFNLVLKDIAETPSVSEVVHTSTLIIKEIKNSHVLKALFVQVQNQNENNVKSTLKLPIKTRFGYLLLCLESLLKNKNNLEMLAVLPGAQKYLSTTTRTNILNSEYWMRVTRINKLIKPVGKWIFYLEGDDPRISQVPEAFYELNQHFINELENTNLRVLNSTEVKKFLTNFHKREATAMKPVHYAANLLDPNYKGAKLTIEQEADGYDVISKVSKKLGLDHDRIMEEYSKYIANDGIWSKDHVKQAVTMISPLKWWQVWCGKTHLNKIAVAILGLPPTSSATERSFSTQGWIHSSKRNRLTVERAGKVTYIAHNVRLLEGKKIKKKPSDADVDTSDDDASDGNDNDNEDENESDNGNDKL